MLRKVGGTGGRDGEEERGLLTADNNAQQLIFLFLLVVLSAVYPAGVQSKNLHTVVQTNSKHTFNTYIVLVTQ